MIALREPERSGIVERGGGRRVGWNEWGPRDGHAVLFCTGAGTSSSLGFGAAAVDALGLRLVCVDRAGLGRSDPDPAKSFESWSDDVGAVLAEARVDRPVVVGFSQGAPFALALAARGLVRAVAIVAGQDELARSSVRATLPTELRSMVDAIATDRAAFEAAFASRVDADGLYSLVVAMSAPIDRAVYAEPAFASAYRRALHEGFARGPGGYVRDVTLAMSRWPWSEDAITVPVQLWYGALDASPVHALDRGEALALRLRAERRVLEGEGGSILWTRAHEILAALVQRSNRSVIGA